MIKSLAALAIFGLLGTAVVAVPGFAPQVKAGETVALPKGDRQPVARNCSQQVWPDFENSCLHKGGSGVMIREVRLVAVRR
jgi:hypothetical protein